MWSGSPDNLPTPLWYLSYATDDGFRGGVFVEAPNSELAAWTARLYELSPGGEVMMIPVPDDKRPDRKWWYRLLTREEIEQASGPTVRSGDIEGFCG